MLSLAALTGAGALASACAGSPACERNSDCSEGYCLDGECKVDCVDAELDCPRGYICNIIGKCEFLGSSGGPGAGGQGGGGQGGGAGGGPGPGGAGGGSAGGGPGAGGGGGAPTAGELDLCTVGQCESGLACKPMVKGGGPSRCARACASHAQCPEGTRCIDDGTGGRCVGHDTGRGCSAASQCNFACLTGPGYCTNTCDSGSDCPNGYGCMNVSSVDVCVKLEALCDGGANPDCVVQAACDLSANLIIGSCTSTCDTAADCPQRALPLAPWTCDGLCRRPGDVYGGLPGGYQPTEWYCDAVQNPVVLCGDAQHIDFTAFTIPSPPGGIDCFGSMSTSGVAGDACVNSCRYQGDCAFGFSCVAVGQVAAQRIGLCLPNGAKEPGIACSNNTECAFGYCVDDVCSRDCTVDGICPGGLSCVSGGAVAVEGMAFRRCE